MSNSPILSQYLTPEEQDKVYTRIELEELASKYSELVFYAPGVKQLNDNHKAALKNEILRPFEAKGKPSSSVIINKIQQDGRFHYFEKTQAVDGSDSFELAKPEWRKFRCLEHISTEHFRETNNSPNIETYLSYNESFNSESTDTSGKRLKRGVVSMSGSATIQSERPYYTYGNDLNKMQTKLKSFNTLAEFAGMSLSNDFTECRYRLRDFICNPDGTNKFPDVEQPEERCKLWANTVTSEYRENKIGWARRLDDDRRTVTHFLKYLYKCLEAENFSKEDCVEILRETLIPELVSLTLPMDRANCLYHMCIKLPGKGRGMAWYAESQTDEAFEAGIDTTSQKHTMNKFYLYFKDNEEFKIGEDLAIKDYWFDIEKKPEYSTTRSEQVPDVVGVEGSPGGTLSDSEFGSWNEIESTAGIESFLREVGFATGEDTMETNPGDDAMESLST